MAIVKSNFKLYGQVGFPGFDGFEQIRALYNSMTKELVFLNQRPLTGDVNNVIKIVPLNDTVENNLKKIMRDNNIFATKEDLLYTH
jgi:hypothetical protein